MKKSHFKSENIKDIQRLLKDGNLSEIKEKHKPENDYTIYIGTCKFHLSGQEQKINIAVEQSRDICRKKIKAFTLMNYDKDKGYCLEMEVWYNGNKTNIEVLK